MDIIEPRLIHNAAECVGCGKVLVSAHVHDYRTHDCSTGRRPIHFMVDGGLEYVRRGWGGPGLSKDPDLHFIERSQYAGQSQ